MLRPLFLDELLDFSASRLELGPNCLDGLFRLLLCSSRFLLSLLAQLFELPLPICLCLLFGLELSSQRGNLPHSFLLLPSLSVHVVHLPPTFGQSIFGVSHVEILEHVSHL